MNVGVVAVGMLARRIGRYDGLAAVLGQPISELAGVVGPVGDQLARQWGTLQKAPGAGQIMSVARRDGEGNRAAMVVGYGVNFGRPSAARAPDGMGEGPPFAPAAERCALT